MPGAKNLNIQALASPTDGLNDKKQNDDHSIPCRYECVHESAHLHGDKFVGHDEGGS